MFTVEVKQQNNTHIVKNHLAAFINGEPNSVLLNDNQLLQLRKARTVWFDPVIKPDWVYLPSS